jgi:predicted metal-binding membrane protein
MAEWRKGTTGAFIMGLRHGAYCIGCCWARMGLLFVVGVMNLPLVAVLALAVAAEKLTPWGNWIARGVGIALILGGGWVLFAELRPHAGMTGMAM